MPTPPGKRIVVLVSGRGSNLQALIRAQQKNTIASRIAAVLSNNPQALAVARAREASIRTLIIPSKGLPRQDYDNRLLAALNELAPELIILAGYMKILSCAIVSRYAQKIINIHPSLLPSFPGLHAHQQALDAGVKITGCTVHFVDEGCDTGPIILQKSLAINHDDSADTLSERLLKKEHDAIVEAVQLIENDKVILQGRKTLILI